MIDIDKLIISLLNRQDLKKSEKKILHHALQEQGLRVKDSGIVSIKPEPKKKPKFKVGDWIVYSGVLGEATMQVKKVENGRYYFDNGSTLLAEDSDCCMRLWTIEDPKEGDVLVTYDGTIVIYQSRCTIDTINVYCCIDNNTFVCGNIGVFDVKGIHPATKEQRELLSTKMKENGYGFDFRTNTLLRVPKLKTATGKLKECLDKLKGEMELTEFENKVGKTLEIAIHDGTKSLEPDTIRYFAQELLPIARKQIASEIDIDAIWGELVFRGVERLSREDIEEFVEKIKKGE